MATIAERATAGAELLDRVRPGWEREIDLSTLDMTTSTQCILGQLWGTWRQGAEALDLMGDPALLGAEAVSYGFDLSWDMSRMDYYPLKVAWRDLIETRRARAADLYYGLRQVIGVVIAGLEHTPAADLGEVQHAIAVLTGACAAGPPARRGAASAGGGEHA